MSKKTKWSTELMVVVGLALFAAAAFFVTATGTTGTPSHFPTTVVINLDDRTDRWKEVQEEFSSWPVPVERVSAVRMKPGWKGCSASHLKCVRLAKERGLPWILILEDDCVLRPDAARRFTDLLPVLWATRDHWDIFNGGVTAVKKHERISYNPPLYEVYGYAANFYLVHAGSYDQILDGHPTNPATFKDPIDVYYADTCRIWTTTPYLAAQRPGPSDINESHKKGVSDYTSVFEQAEQKLLKLK
jgi:GR25 family glycosyltransferase involved in LPS biosynthesis